MKVKVLLRVRFAECDAQDIVFNARYADYADVASTEYMRFMCGGYEQLTESGYATQVVNLNISWFASARFDDVLLLEMYCERIGNTSFTLKCDISNAKTNAEIASATITYVLLDTNSGIKTPIPEDLRKKLESESENGPVNLAGVIDEIQL